MHFFIKSVEPTFQTAGPISRHMALEGTPMQCVRWCHNICHVFVFQSIILKTNLNLQVRNQHIFLMYQVFSICIKVVLFTQNTFLYQIYLKYLKLNVQYCLLIVEYMAAWNCVCFCACWQRTCVCVRVCGNIICMFVIELPFKIGFKYEYTCAKWGKMTEQANREMLRARRGFGRFLHCM